MLDIFSINDENFQFVYATSIIPCYRTDHSEILLNLKVQYNGRGKGYWKFNHTLWKDSDDEKLVKSTINEVTSTYIIQDAEENTNN